MITHHWLRPALVVAACCALICPAADAKPKHPPQAHRTRRAAPRDPINLPATAQLAAMQRALRAAPLVFPGSTGCTAVTPLLANVAGNVMAGNFRDSDGNCYVWLNLAQSALLTQAEICKVSLHEIGHLTALAHSPVAADVMFAPFQPDPIPQACLDEPARA